MVEASISTSFQEDGVRPRSRFVEQVPELAMRMPLIPQKNGTCLWPDTMRSMSRVVSWASRSPASMTMLRSRPVPGTETRWWWMAKILMSSGSSNCVRIQW